MAVHFTKNLLGKIKTIRTLSNYILQFMNLLIREILKDNRLNIRAIQLSVSVFWMIFSASVGRAAKNRNALAMCVYPQIRRSVRTVLRRAAMTCGMLPHRTCEASSPRSTSRVRCERFSIAQCPRRICNKRLAVA